MNHLEKIELIERYHRHQLNDAEQQAFEDRLRAEPDFAAEVEGYCDIFDGFDMLHMEQFEAQLQQFEANARAEAKSIAEPATQPQKSPMKAHRGGLWANLRMLAAAAAIGLFATTSYYMFVGQTSPFDDHFRPIPALLVDAHRAPSSLSAERRACQDAFTAYNSPQNYEKALPMLQQYADQYGMTPQVQLYIGISQLYLNKFPDATNNLLAVANNTDKKMTDYQQEAEYMLALAYHRQNNNAKAHEILNKIMADPHHNHKSHAAALSQDLPK